MEGRVANLESLVAQQSRQIQELLTSYNSQSAKIQHLEKTIQQLQLQGSRTVNGKHDSVPSGEFNLGGCNGSTQDLDSTIPLRSGYNFSESLCNKRLLTHASYRLLHQALSQWTSAPLSEVIREGPWEYAEFEISDMHHKSKNILFGIVNESVCKEIQENALNDEKFSSDQTCSLHVATCQTFLGHEVAAAAVVVDHKRGSKASIDDIKPEINEGDKIGMLLSIAEGSLTFYHNGSVIRQVKNIDTVREQWRFAVSLETDGDCVYLVRNATIKR